MADPRTYQFDLPAQRPAHASLDEQWYPGMQSAALNASSKRIYDPLLGIRAIVIHATAGSSSAGAVSVISAGKASFHWLVPDENEEQHGKFVWATCHEARAAWHVRNAAHHPDIWGNRPKINHYSLGIEVVNLAVERDEYSPWQVEATARIVRHCWVKYPNLRHVVSHAKLDPGRRSDPGPHFPWDRFRELVLHGQEETAPALVAAAHPPNAAELGAVPCCMPA